MNKELEKLIQMSKSRRGPQLAIGVNTPLEIKEAILKSGRGQVKRGVGVGIHVLMEKPQREAVNNLAAELDLNVAEMIRMVLRAATVLGSKGLIAFVDSANKVETADLKAKFKKSKRRSAINEGPEIEGDEESEFRYKDDDEPEKDEDGERRERRAEAPATGEPTPTFNRRRTDRRHSTGTPRPTKKGTPTRHEKGGRL